jgi:hypothetical protein
MTNPLIQEIHAIRQEYAKRFKGDLKAICDDARKKQGHDGHKLVPPNPKPKQGVNRSS